MRAKRLCALYKKKAEYNFAAISIIILSTSCTEKNIQEKLNTVEERAQQEKNSSKKMIFNAFQFLKNKNKLIYFTLQHFWKHFWNFQSTNASQ